MGVSVFPLEWKAVTKGGPVHLELERVCTLTEELWVKRTVQIFTPSMGVPLHLSLGVRDTPQRLHYMGQAITPQ